MSTSAQLLAWLNGTPTGGPNSDGRYPMVYADGQTYLVYCPAAQALNPALNEQPIEVFANTATAAAGTATTQAATATTAALAAQTSAANALASKIAVQDLEQVVQENTDVSDANATAAGDSATAASGSATTASTANTNAGLARDKAQKWADEAVDTTVEPAKYSARHWAQKAADSVAGGHVHTITDITGLQTALDAKLASASFTWAGLAGKPATFAPSAHTHVITDVTGLQTTLDGKQTTIGYTPMNRAGDTMTGEFSVNLNVPALSGSAYLDGHLELITSDGSSPRIGFHRAGLTAAALYYSGQDGTGPIMGLRNNSNADYRIAYRNVNNSWSVGQTFASSVQCNATGELTKLTNNGQWSFQSWNAAGSVLAGGIWRDSDTSLRFVNGTFDAEVTLVSGQVNTSGRLQNNSGIRVTGSVTFGAGAGVEMYYSAERGYVIAYDRTAAAWKDMRVYGQAVELYAAGSLVATASTAGFTILGHLLSSNSGLQINSTTRRVSNDNFILAANSASWVREPRVFVQSGDPGAAAADGDLWAW